MTDVRAIRREMGVTQIELAARLGLHQSTISRLESGDLPVDERTALALEALSSRLIGNANRHAPTVTGRRGGSSAGKSAAISPCSEAKQRSAG